MRLTLEKDREHNLTISSRITEPEEFMYSAYQQALDALNEIIKSSRAALINADRGHNYEFYGYCHNIIAFSGERGQGKTSAMLSFSRAMSNSFDGEDLKNRDTLKEYSYTVLPPIDPTVLEKDNSILSVVLARMYRLAEDAWENSCTKQSNSMLYGQSEAEKNNILKLFQKCLSGINAIKFREGKEIQSLFEIQEISDSSVLKNSFYQLTNCLLKFINNNNFGSGKNYLILQLDDTDFQIRKGYEIFEDIRKYLTLPNIVILMATDLKMLRVSIGQHFVNEFQVGLEEEIIEAEALHKIGNKYIDKLIPPTHAIYLANLDDIIQQQAMVLQIQYRGWDINGKEIDLLFPPEHHGSVDDFTLQELILRYVYRKTRIAFSAPKAYMHEFIPTTLRGLAQLLGILSSMQDVPEIDPNSITDPHALAEKIDEQVRILEVNLPIFEHYFLGDWIHAKLSFSTAGDIDKLETVLPQDRFQAVFPLLEEAYYAPYLDRSTKQSYADMKNHINMLRKIRNFRYNILFYFSLYTFFTIKFHKAVLNQKKLAIAPYLENENKSDLLLFDFSPERTNLPDQYYQTDDKNKPINQTNIYTINDKDYKRIESLVQNEEIMRILFRREDIGYHISLTNFINLFLSLGAPAVRDNAKNFTKKSEWLQRDLYLAQTAAATFAINVDVQNVCMDVLETNFISGDSNRGLSDHLGSLLLELDKVICAINCKKPMENGKEYTPMISSNLSYIMTVLDKTNISNKGKFLAVVGKEIDGSRFNMLCEIYNRSEKLISTLISSNDAGQIDIEFSQYSAIVNKYDRQFPSDGIMQIALLDKETIESMQPKSREEKFETCSELRKKVRGFIEGIGYSMNEVMKRSR